jgi:hypothetical protein
MAFIQVQADLRETNRLLERLVRVGERFLLERYGIRMGHCTEPSFDRTGNGKESVPYAAEETPAWPLLNNGGGTVEEEEGEVWMEE